MTQTIVTNSPKICKPVPRHVPRFVDFSTAKKAHIAGLLAALRQAVREAREEVLTDGDK